MSEEWSRKRKNGAVHFDRPCYFHQFQAFLRQFTPRSVEDCVRRVFEGELRAMDSGTSQCPLRGINTLGGPPIVASRDCKNRDAGREVEGDAGVGDAGYGEGPFSAADRANAPELCGTLAAGDCLPPVLSAHPAAPRWGSEDLRDFHIEEDSLWRYQQPQQRGRAGAPMVRSYSTTAPPNATFGQGSHYLCCQKIELIASRPWTKLHPEPHTPCFCGSRGPS